MFYTGAFASARLELTKTLGKSMVPLFLVWTVYTAYIFLHSSALVPDEKFFLSLAGKTSYWSFLTEPTSQLYGSLYWVCLKLCSHAFVARLFALIMFLLTPYLVIKTIDDPKCKLLAFCLWLTMPAAWWGGKLIAPEIPTMFLVSVALYFYDRKKFVGVGVALGLAVGIKVIALPALVFFVLSFLLADSHTSKEKMQLIPKIAFAFFVSVFISYPPIIVALKSMFGAASEHSAISIMDAVRKTLFLDRWEWDVAYSGGVLNFSLQLVSFGLFCAALLIGNCLQALVFIATAVVFLAMNAMNDNGYGWYWFPILPIVIYMFGKFSSGRRERAVLCLALLALGANAYLQAPLIADFIYQKSAQIRIMSNDKQIVDCLSSRVNELSPATVFNGVDMNLIFLDGEKTKYYDTPYDADVALLAPRSLHSKRNEYFILDQGLTIYAMCDSVLVLVKNK
jgi:hypothetical protein